MGPLLPSTHLTYLLNRWSSSILRLCENTRSTACFPAIYAPRRTIMNQSILLISRRTKIDKSMKSNEFECCKFVYMYKIHIIVVLHVFTWFMIIEKTLESPWYWSVCLPPVDCTTPVDCLDGKVFPHWVTAAAPENSPSNLSNRDKHCAQPSRSQST